MRMATRKKAPRKRTRRKSPSKSPKKAPKRRTARPRAEQEASPWVGKLVHVLEQVEADPEAAVAKVKQMGALGAALVRRANTHPQEVAEVVKPMALRALAKALKQSLL